MKDYNGKIKREIDKLILELEKMMGKSSLTDSLKLADEIVVLFRDADVSVESYDLKRVQNIINIAHHNGNIRFVANTKKRFTEQYNKLTDPNVANTKEFEYLVTENIKEAKKLFYKMQDDNCFNDFASFTVRELIDHVHNMNSNNKTLRPLKGDLIFKLTNYLGKYNDKYLDKLGYTLDINIIPELKIINSALLKEINNKEQKANQMKYETEKVVPEIKSDNQIRLESEWKDGSVQPGLPTEGVFDNKPKQDLGSLFKDIPNQLGLSTEGLFIDAPKQNSASMFKDIPNQSGLPTEGVFTKDARQDLGSLFKDIPNQPAVGIEKSFMDIESKDELPINNQPVIEESKQTLPTDFFAELEALAEAKRKLEADANINLQVNQPDIEEEASKKL